MNSSVTAKVDKREDLTNKKVYRPWVDIQASENGYLLVADMPGVDEKSVDIKLADGVLTVAGKSTVTIPESCKQVYSEYKHGDYQRQFKISKEIDPDKIEANIKNGILTIHLPKQEALKPRVIKVK